MDERNGTGPAEERASRDRSAQTIERIRAALEGLRYGEVVVKVQDGVVVQIERTERARWKANQ